MQTQMVDALEDCEFRGHGAHVLSATAPRGAEYLPAAQSVHVAVPVIILYFPPAHAVHAPVDAEYFLTWISLVLLLYQNRLFHHNTRSNCKHLHHRLLY
jgi:hypothetical protein